jgi:hypothetical protein
MSHEDDLYRAIGEISARHAMLDDAVEYFYNVTARRLGGPTRAIEQFMFANKLDLLAKMMKRDRDRGYRRRVEAWMRAARVDETWPCTLRTRFSKTTRFLAPPNTCKFGRKREYEKSRAFQKCASSLPN